MEVGLHHLGVVILEQGRDGALQLLGIEIIRDVFGRTLTIVLDPEPVEETLEQARVSLEEPELEHLRGDFAGAAEFHVLDDPVDLLGHRLPLDDDRTEFPVGSEGVDRRLVDLPLLVAEVLEDRKRRLRLHVLEELVGLFHGEEEESCLRDPKQKSEASGFSSAILPALRPGAIVIPAAVPFGSRLAKGARRR